MHRLTRDDSFQLPASGEVVSFDRIQAICSHYGLRTLWSKIETDPPVLLGVRAQLSRDQSVARVVDP